MGHRASVAYLRDDGSVVAHYSHWGALNARLAFGDDHERINRDHPFGQSGGEPEFVKALRESLTSATPEDTTVVANTEVDSDVDQKPYGEFDDLTDWVRNGIDFVFHECVYVVDREWNVRAFGTADGVLVELESADEWPMPEKYSEERIPEFCQ